LVKLVWDKGYDHQFGGPYKDYNRVTGDMLMWGVTDTAKAWWQMEQAVTAGLMLYQITGKSVYLQMADESLDFFMKYFVDHVYGDVYADRTRYGKQVAAWGDDKGNSGKAGYHSVELGYYVYLYGKLLLKHEAATLYYNFRADSTLRKFSMTPISLPDAQLRIKEVKLKDSLYTNVDYADRVLTIPPGVGGTFSVTYEGAIPSFVALSPAVSPPVEFELAQNYPNPFNPTTHLRFTIADLRFVTLKVFDVLGREVATLVDGQKVAGVYELTFDASSLTSGVYFYRMSAGSFSETKKMLLLR
jgi:Secretion system C-terminal sorting domain/N-acylglucosamine 2-epimerase (GlcNAc 2-epimerase)